MTGATGDLTPDDVQRDLDTGERREVEDPLHEGAAAGPESPSPGGDDQPALEASDPRVGGDTQADHEDHF